MVHDLGLWSLKDTIGHVRGLGRLKRIYRKARRTLVPGVVILMYHRVAAIPGYNTPLVVAPNNFERHMEYIRKKCHSMHLLELAEVIQKKRLPKRAVVITFDDGYIDSYLEAFPVLEHFNVPSTIFVSSASINSSRGFWWDELDNILLSPTNRPEMLIVTIKGKMYEWHLGPNSKRIEIRKKVNSLLRPLSTSERETVLAELRTWAGTLPEYDSECRPMTAEELRQLQQNQLIHLGAHTKTHPLLSLLSLEEQYEEIVGGCRELESVIGQSVDSFAYPYGDFNDISVEIVGAAGFKAACTTLPGIVESGDDVVQLPRFWVGNWNVDTFKQKMERFLSS